MTSLAAIYRKVPTVMEKKTPCTIGESADSIAIPRMTPNGVVKENRASNLAAFSFSTLALANAIPIARAAAHLCKAMAANVSSVLPVPSYRPIEMPANMLWIESAINRRYGPQPLPVASLLIELFTDFLILSYLLIRNEPYEFSSSLSISSSLACILLYVEFRSSCSLLSSTILWLSNATFSINNMSI